MRNFLKSSHHITPKGLSYQFLLAQPKNCILTPPKEPLVFLSKPSSPRLAAAQVDSHGGSNEEVEWEYIDGSSGVPSEEDERLDFLV
ncbi:hypothetical protein E3N88_13194 [Mikania micrantha]|uniref:Uncharacterized protein n=1 Tax=Mikania micrantha TaxID=192012 RepID=A0A5N6P7W7_9ASTR|nr:hypothetical protein E3N88_13194 [Mikania micrantha]